MRTDPDPFDKTPDPTTFLLEPANGSGLFATRPNASSDPDLPIVDQLSKQVEVLSQKLAEEHQKRVNEHLMNQCLLALNEFDQDLENAIEPELAAHSMAKMLAGMTGCDLVGIFSCQPEDGRYKLLASSGPSAHRIPAGYVPDLNNPAINQAIVHGQVVTTQDFLAAGASSRPRTASGPKAPLDAAVELLQIAGQRFSSMMAAPLLRRGVLHGLILLADSREEAFGSGDAPVLSAAAVHLMNTWDFIQQNEILTEFVQTVTMMSVIQEVGSLLEMVASIARRTLNASYTLVATHNQQEWLTRGSGRAPLILRSLQNGASQFLEEAVKSPYTFRMIDLRRDARSAVIHLDSPELCTLLASPIRLNGVTTGILLAFGKNGGAGFSDLDVFLAERLVEHAAANLESCYLNHELRANLKTTQLLYDLSLSITQAESLTDAARAIALTAYRLMKARQCGLILFSPDGRVEAEVRFPSDDPTISHPYRLIQQAIDSRQTIYLSESENISRSATPIQTMRRCYGALWVEFVEESKEDHQPTEEIRILVNQAAVALERSILLEETRQQNIQITNAYEDLLYGLTKALDTRDRETENHSKRVEELSVQLGSEMGLTGKELEVLKRGALLHDIGKIGVPDFILHKPGPLDDAEWKEMRQHPQKGAEIIQEIPALRDALPVIAFHQERWDGSGYPLQLRGTDIPLLARIFAVVDVYDALTSNRPYRTPITPEEALAHLAKEANIHFDPEIVQRFSEMIRAGCTPVSTGFLKPDERPPR